jgi:DNA polymerase (family 10)
VKNRGIKLLIGMEVDIRPDGDLALSDKLMNLLDYAIVSIHSSFERSMEENTKRIIEGLSHPRAIILGHPTGRMLNERDPINANWDKIFDFCSVNKKIIEVNASPNRQDLPDDLVRLAVKKGVKLILNTDSHNASQMYDMKFGVWQTRKGYGTKKDIINTLSKQNFLSVIK